MGEHPFSVWTLREIPGGDPNGVPAPADIESWGATWKAASYEYLVGVAARAFAHNSDTATMAALIESQRRLTAGIDHFEASTRDLQTQLLTAIRASSDSADKFAVQAQKLNTSIR